MAGDERRAEIEAVARVLWPEYRVQDAVNLRKASEAIAALDCLRDARGDDEAAQRGHWVQPEAFCEQPTCQAKNDGRCHVPENCGHFQPKERWVPARSPQGEGLEALYETVRIAAVESSDVWLRTRAQEVLSRVSPSRDGTVAVEDVREMLETVYSPQGHVTSETLHPADAFDRWLKRRFARSATGEQTDHGGDQ